MSEGDAVKVSGWYTNYFGPQKRITDDSGLYVSVVLPLAVDLPAFRLEPEQLDGMIQLLEAAKVECVAYRQAHMPAETGRVA